MTKFLMLLCLLPAFAWAQGEAPTPTPAVQGDGSQAQVPALAVQGENAEAALSRLATKAENAADRAEKAADRAERAATPAPASDSQAQGGEASNPKPQAGPIQVPRTLDIPFTSRLVNLMGLVVMMVLAWFFSTNHRKIHWRVIVWGLILQVGFGFLVLRTGPGRAFFDAVAMGVSALLGFYNDGARLVFGSFMDMENVPFALSVVPTVIFFSALMAILYHLGFMQKLVGGLAWIMRKTMKTSGAESLSAAGNIFVGQTEAPLLVKPYIAQMTQSELMAVMVGGFATVAGGVMVAYTSMLQGQFPDIAGHLMSASVMSAPASLIIAKLMVPEDGSPLTANTGVSGERDAYANVIDAAAGGAADGMRLALNMAAMLIAFVAIVSLLNAILGWTGGFLGLENLSFQRILGWICSPIAWLMGVPWSDAPVVGGLIGEKTILNEFYAYNSLAELMKVGALGPRSIVAATYALCGFANFGSVAIVIGGMSAMAPNRRSDLASLGIKAMIGGTLAAFMTANVAGMLL